MSYKDKEYEIPFKVGDLVGMPKVYDYDKNMVPMLVIDIDIRTETITLYSAQRGNVHLWFPEIEMLGIRRWEDCR
jgi:hypothetical protein